MSICPRLGRLWAGHSLSEIGVGPHFRLLFLRVTYSPQKRVLIVSIFSLLLNDGQAMADAIMRSEAMFADTIAEFFIEDDHIRLELEIGFNDVGSFRNLLPDALYQQLNYGDAPLAAGESAVAGLAGLLCAAGDPVVRKTPGLTSDSRILLFGTEDATDPVIYEKIVGRPASAISKASI